nr:unnamed protein product [Callosobruchus analis]
MDYNIGEITDYGVMLDKSTTLARTRKTGQRIWPKFSFLFGSEGIGKSFRMGQAFLENDEEPGRPVKVITKDKMALVEELVPSDRQRRLKFLMAEVVRLNVKTSVSNVEWLAEHFLDDTAETSGGALNSRQKLQIFLRSLSDPGFKNGVGNDEGVPRTTASKTVKFVLMKIIKKISYLHNNSVVDCTHIRTPKPSEHGDEYYNRKGYFCMHVQATCNAKKEFTSIDAQ